MKRVILFGAIGGVLIALLRLIEYQYLVRTFPSEVYGGLIAVIFSVVGITLGLRFTKPKEVVVVKEVEVTREVTVTVVKESEPTPFALDSGKLAELGITPREHEVLVLIAEGLSNREIGEKLFVSENTIKTHSSRVFEKLGVSRRVQAVQKARELKLLA